MGVCRKKHTKRRRNNAERAYFIAEHFHESEDKVIVSNFFIFQLTQKRPKNDYKIRVQKRHEYLHNH